jgi:hypothetical protein
VIAEPLPTAAPVTFVWLTVHENVVPTTVLDRATDVVPPEQNVCEEGVDEATGTGSTVIVTLIGLPTQPFAVGVIV